VINHGTAKKLLETIYAQGGDPAQLVEAQGLAQVSDESILTETIRAVLDDHPGEVGRYLAGEDKLIKFLMGKVMRAMGGKGEAAVVQRLLAEQLESRR
jgi:Asp-tRNA(Asn)/Glu-tRNA(Gln) amidotransferase B subunit